MTLLERMNAARDLTDTLRWKSDASDTATADLLRSFAQAAEDLDYISRDDAYAQADAAASEAADEVREELSPDLEQLREEVATLLVFEAFADAYPDLLVAFKAWGEAIEEDRERTRAKYRAGAPLPPLKPRRKRKTAGGAS